MKLRSLITSIGHLVTGQAPEDDLLISSIEYDSRHISMGSLFVAIPGETVDGHGYIASAIEKGAAAVICEVAPQGLTVPVITVTDARKALAALSACFYGNPAETLTMVGVTGTNGKTTITYILESIFEAAGLKCGVMGTVSTRFNGQEVPSAMTTPESRDIQKTLAQMVDTGVTHAIMEVSSHALAMERAYACPFDAAIFTNLTQDHLDYHGSMGIYWDTKKRLFTQHLKEGGVGVINAANEKGRELINDAPCALFPVGNEGSSLASRNICVAIDGISGELVTAQGAFPFCSRSTGRYNLENILCAAGAALSVGVSMKAVVKGINTFRVPGRLERVENEKDLHLFVDYAHTPDALENVLGTLRSLVPGKLISVFGCGGDRDRTKRPLMGGIGTRFSDVAVITSDNPRSEDPLSIMDDITKGIDEKASTRHDADTAFDTRTPKGFLVEPDRRKAIAIAMAAAIPGDTVLIAGKGHETYQIIGDTCIDFDDRVEALKAVRDA